MEYVTIIIFFLWRCDPTRVMASFLGFLDHTQRRTTVGRTPLEERCYIIFHNSLLRTTYRIPKSVDTIGKNTCEICSKTLEELCNKASVRRKKEEEPSVVFGDNEARGLVT
jgi:hypothetical protein